MSWWTGFSRGRKIEGGGGEERDVRSLIEKELERQGERRWMIEKGSEERKRGRWSEQVYKYLSFPFLSCSGAW